MSSLAEVVITMEREKEKKSNEESEKKTQNMLSQLANVSDGLMMERDNQAVLQKLAQESEQNAQLEKSSTMQKLIAETSEVMLASLGPSWTHHDYTKFVEGLFGTQAERDVRK